MRDFFGEVSRDDLSAVTPATRADLAKAAIWTVIGVVAAGIVFFFVVVKYKPMD